MAGGGLATGAPVAAGAAGKDFEAVSARGAGGVGVVTIGERTAVPVFSGEVTVGEGLMAFWAKPGVSAPLANAIPRTQPDSFRVFI
jgi:hypothetical protein